MVQTLPERARVVFKLLLIIACGFAISRPALAQTAAPSTWKVIEERWYIMEIGGAKVGWTSNIAESDGSRIRTTEHSHIKVERGEAAVKISTESSFIETA